MVLASQRSYKGRSTSPAIWSLLVSTSKWSVEVYNQLHCYRNSHTIWYHSVTCHPAEVTFSPLPPAN